MAMAFASGGTETSWPGAVGGGGGGVQPRAGLWRRTVKTVAVVATSFGSEHWVTIRWLPRPSFRSLDRGGGRPEPGCVVIASQDQAGLP